VSRSETNHASVNRSGFVPVLLILAAWVFAGWLFVNVSRPADATADYRLRHMTMQLVVPYQGQWWNVDVGMFLYDDQVSDFGEAASEAREHTLQRFPGAIEVAHSNVQGQYVINGYSWTSGSASWAYNPAGKSDGLSGDSQAMQAGAQVWNNAGANFQFVGGSTTTAGTGACSGGGLDGQNTVGWKAQSGSILAVTCTWHLNGVAQEFDMEFDPQWNWTTGSPIQVDLQSVAAHEFGHAAGLGHSADSSAVMYFSYSVGTNKRNLHQDDIDGLVAIYGPSGGAVATPTKTPTNTPVPQETPTPTNTPVPGATSTPTPPPGSDPTATPTPSLPFSPPGSGPSPSPTPTRTPTPVVDPTATPTPNPLPPSLSLLPGVNLVGWPAKDTDVHKALGGQGNVIKVVYSWNATAGRWDRFGPNMPAYVNSLTTLQQGKAYWIIATAAAQVLIEP
jgi:hypothetical protein